MTGREKLVFQPIRGFCFFTRESFGFQQSRSLFLGAFLFRYVANNLRRADDPAAFISNRRNRERNVDQRAVLPFSNGFVVID